MIHEMMARINKAEEAIRKINETLRNVRNSPNIVGYHNSVLMLNDHLDAAAVNSRIKRLEEGGAI